ncbi:MAG: hypothetical protein WCG66_03815 [bacterium]|jgi:hypothetical protein
MIIAIPSKGRAGRTKTLSVLPNATLFVPALEAESYRLTGAKNVIGVPDDVRGITKTRNWILKNTDDPHIVMIDDDVKAQGWVKLNEEKSQHKKLNESAWLSEFEKLFDITYGMSFRIWGVATQSAPRSVYPYRPLLWRSYITASCMGIINEGRTFFDESFPVKEDYELNLRCIKEDGGIVAARHIYWENSHWHDEGGCHDYRTQKLEADCIKKLEVMYPGMIKVTKRANSEFCIAITV